MIKSTLLRNLVILVGCVCPLRSFAQREDSSALTLISIPQDPPTMGEASVPTLDPQSGAIATLEGREIGEVEDFILDLGAGCIAYIVGAFNHAPQLRDKLFVIPWERVRLAPEMENFAFVGDEITLEEAPHISLAAWRHQPLSRWTSLTDRYWKEKHWINTGRQSGPRSTFSKASDLLGLTVQSTSREDVGTIEGLLLSPETGTISYVLLSSETEQTNNKIFFALPWSTIRVYSKQHFLSTERNQSRASQVPKGFCDTPFSSHPIKYCQQKRIRRHNEYESRYN